MSDDEPSPTTIYQLCLLPEAWPKVKEFVERQWPAFQVVRFPTSAEEAEAGIHTFGMALK